MHAKDAATTPRSRLQVRPCFTDQELDRMVRSHKMYEGFYPRSYSDTRVHVITEEGDRLASSLSWQAVSDQRIVAGASSLDDFCRDRGYTRKVSLAAAPPLWAMFGAATETEVRAPHAAPVASPADTLQPR